MLAQELAKTQAINGNTVGTWVSLFCQEVPLHSLATLVDLFHRWATATTTAAWHTTAWHTTLWHATATCCLVDLHHDRIDDPLELLLLCLELILFGHLIL